MLALFGVQQYAFVAAKASTSLESVMCITRVDVPELGLSRRKRRDARATMRVCETDIGVCSPIASKSLRVCWRVLGFTVKSCPGRSQARSDPTTKTLEAQISHTRAAPTVQFVPLHIRPCRSSVSSMQNIFQGQRDAMECRCSTTMRDRRVSDIS